MPGMWFGMSGACEPIFGVLRWAFNHFRIDQCGPKVPGVGRAVAPHDAGRVVSGREGPAARPLMPLTVEAATMPGLLLIRTSVHADERGWFTEVYKASALAEVGVPEDFRQDNVSWSERRGTLRGLHLQQAPAAQGKLVRCLRGAIFDVVVDLRR